MTFSQYLTETENPLSQDRLRHERNKIDWRREADDEMDQDLRAPYFVGWSGQAHEWYGNGSPESGDGRYKPKGNSGEIVAINIPTHEMALEIADKLDNDYKNNSFYDKFVYAEPGEDYSITDYAGAYVMSMSKMDQHDERDLSHLIASGKVRDYSK